MARKSIGRKRGRKSRKISRKITRRKSRSYRSYRKSLRKFGKGHSNPVCHGCHSEINPDQDPNLRGYYICYERNCSAFYHENHVPNNKKCKCGSKLYYNKIFGNNFGKEHAYPVCYNCNEEITLGLYKHCPNCNVNYCLMYCTPDNKCQLCDHKFVRDDCKRLSC